MIFLCIILIGILLLIIRDRFVPRNKKIFTRATWLYITGTIEFWLEIKWLKFIVVFAKTMSWIINPIVCSMYKRRVKKGIPSTDARIVRLSNFNKTLMVKEYKASSLLKRYNR